MAACRHEELVVPVAEGEGGEVRVLVHTPAHLAPGVPRPALVYAHGGAVLAGSAELYTAPMALLALRTGIPVYNVDYRCTGPTIMATTSASSARIFDQHITQIKETRL